MKRLCEYPYLICFIIVSSSISSFLPWIPFAKSEIYQSASESDSIRPPFESLLLLIKSDVSWSIASEESLCLSKLIKSTVSEDEDIPEGCSQGNGKFILN